MAGEEDVMVGHYLGKLNGKPNADGKRLALHLPFGSLKFLKFTKPKLQARVSTIVVEPQKQEG